MEFHMLCGIPGSGKSTLGKNLSGYTVSTDAIRKFLWQDESVVKHDRLVFELADSIINYCLATGLDVVFDATNLKKERRIKYIAIAKVHQARVTVHWVDCPLPLAIKRNLARERKVPVPVICGLGKSFQPPALDEGMELIRIYSPDLSLAAEITSP